MTTLADMLATQTEEELLAQFLVDAAASGMPATGWQAERLPRALFGLQAKTHARWQATRALVVNGGFLDLATGGWLDLLAAGFFRLTRTPATFTVGKLRLTDVASAGPTTVTAGTSWAVGTNGLRYLNTETKTCDLDGYVDIIYKAEIAGAGSNANNGTITQLTTPIPGFTINNPAIGATGTWITAAGSDAESDRALRDRCRNRWGSLGAGGNVDAYEFWITEAEPLITRYWVDDSNPNGPGSIDVYLANAAGAASGAQVTAVDDYLQPRKALGSSTLRTFAASDVSVPITGTIYATGNAAAVADAVAALAVLQADYPLAATLYKAEIIARIMGVTGVYNVSLSAPAADVSVADSQVIVFDNTTLTLG